MLLCTYASSALYMCCHELPVCHANLRTLILRMKGCNVGARWLLAQPVQYLLINQLGFIKKRAVRIFPVTMQQDCHNQQWIALTVSIKSKNNNCISWRQSNLRRMIWDLQINHNMPYCSIMPLQYSDMYTYNKPQQITSTSIFVTSLHQTEFHPVTTHVT
jgi:hypothetical protein